MIRRVVNSTLEPTTTGLKVQRSNQLSYLCLKDRAVDGYFRRVTTGFGAAFENPLVANGYIFLVGKTRRVNVIARHRRGSSKS